MNAKSVFTRVVLLVCTGMLMICTRGPGDITGNSSQTPNALVGTLFEPDGRTPAKGVRVQIRPRNTLAVIQSVGLTKKLADTATVMTNNNGIFAFDTSISEGVYAVEATSGTNAAFIDSVQVSKSLPADTLAPVTLQPAGAIQGTARLSLAGEGDIYVLIFGIDRFTKADTDGSFIFGGLAPGVYSLRFITTADGFTVFDTSGVTVSCADTTGLGEVTVPQRDAPVPQNVTLYFDTLRQVVSLVWSPCRGGAATGYSVYRRNVTLDEEYGTPLGAGLQIDTAFTDTTCIQDRTYEYCVTATFGENRESPKSESKTVTVTSRLVVDTVLYGINDGNENASLFDMTVTSSGDICLRLTGENFIRVYDPAMMPKDSVGNAVFQYQTIRFFDNTIFAQQLDQNSWKQNILVIPLSGDSIDTVYATERQASFDVNYGLMAFGYSADTAGDNGSVKIRSIDGSFDTTWNGYNCTEVCVTGTDGICLALARTSDEVRIVECNLQGTVLEECWSSNAGNISELAYDASRHILYAAYEAIKSFREGTYPRRQAGIVEAYNVKLQLVARYKVIDGFAITGLSVNPEGTLLIGVTGISGSIEDRIIRCRLVEQ